MIFCLISISLGFIFSAIIIILCRKGQMPEKLVFGYKQTDTEDPETTPEVHQVCPTQFEVMIVNQ